MIRNSLIAAFVAFLVSLLINGAGWLGFFGPSLPEEAGGADTELADAAQTFEELAEVPEPPELPEPIQPDVPPTQAQIASDNPQETLTPDSGTETQAEPPGEITEEDASPPAATEQAEAAEGSPDAQAEAQAEPSQDIPTEPSQEPQQPDAPELALAPSPELPEISAIEDDPVEDTAVTRSLRPPSERPSALALGAPDGAAEDSADQAVGAQTQRTGLDILADAGSAIRVGRNPFSDARSAGNARRTNYAGIVYQQLNRRVQRIYTNERGTAQIAFQIDPDGSIAWVRVIRSTGTEDIGRAAISGVRSAGPFPPTPNREPVTLTFVYSSKLHITR